MTAPNDDDQTSTTMEQGDTSSLSGRQSERHSWPLANNTPMLKNPPPQASKDLNDDGLEAEKEDALLTTPLTKSATSPGTGEQDQKVKSQDEGEEEEPGEEEPGEEELPPDTHSLLMVCKHPLVEGWFSKSTDENSDNVDDNGETTAMTTLDPAAGDDMEKEQHTNEAQTVGQGTTRKSSFSDKICFPFWLSLIVLACQAFACVVVFSHAFQDEPPANADVTLRLGQIFAMLISSCTQDDFIEGVTLLTDGCNAFKGQSIAGLEFCRSKFCLSTVLRIMLGMAGMASTFLLIMHSTEVVEMLLNFAAMEFVTAIAKASFVLATKGFLGKRMVAQTEAIEDYLHKSQVPTHARFMWCLGNAFVAFAAFGIFWWLQSHRLVGLDNEACVQLDGGVSPELFSTSGVCKGCKGFRTRATGNIGHVDINAGGAPTKCPDRKRNEPVHPDAFVCCWDLGGWVFARQETTEPCNKENHILRSFLEEGGADADSFDLLTHSDANWVVKRAQCGGEACLEHVFIESPEDFTIPFIGCNVLEVDGQDFQMLNSTCFPVWKEKDSNVFDGDSQQRLNEAFEPMCRPVCCCRESDSSDIFTIVFFDGLSWMLLDLNPLKFAEIAVANSDGCSQDDDPHCWRAFLKCFHDNCQWLFDPLIANVAAMSDPMHLLTESDTGFPTASLKWHHVEAFQNEHLEPEQEIDILVQCAATDIVCPLSNEVSFRMSVIADEFPEEFAILAFFGNELADMASKRMDHVREPEREQVIDFASFDWETLVHIQFSDNVEEQRHDFTACVPETECVQALLIDRNGDGLQDPGRFDLFCKDVRQTGFAGSEDSSDDAEFSCMSFQVGEACSRPRMDDAPVQCNLKNVTSFHPDGCPFSSCLGTLLP